MTGKMPVPLRQMPARRPALPRQSRIACQDRRDARPTVSYPQGWRSSNHSREDSGNGAHSILE